jgi:hypothetical protein
MARAEVTGRKPRVRAAAAANVPPIRGPPVPPACFTIKTFCLAHHISEAMFFKMREMEIGPDVMQVGRRVLITFESAARWRSQREAATTAGGIRETNSVVVGPATHHADRTAG